MKIILILILLILLSGCGIVTNVEPGIYTVSEFDYGIERVDYAENFSVLPPGHICPAIEVKVPLYIYHIADDTVCYKCKDESRAILNGWVENNATVCVIK